jgi:hypothetical protein
MRRGHPCQDADGQRRIVLSAAEPSEVFFKLTGDDRALRHRISTTLSLMSRPVDALDEEEVAALRVVASPASVIVGFVPDTPGVDSLSAAIDSRLGALHVDPARPWSTASRLDVQLDVALRALEEAGRLDEEEAAWLAGRLDINATDEAGLLTYPDVRAAYLLLQIRKADSITAKALRALTARQRISPKLRAEIAEEGALRVSAVR